MGRVFFIFILAAFMAAAGYDLLPPPAGARAAEPFERDVVDILTGDGKRHRFRVEIVSTPADRSQGLQGRRQLDPDAGMLFDFGVALPVTMWMKNTYIALDMIFIAADGRIANIARATTPESLAVIESSGPVRAVLEVPAGTAARLGIKPGDKVEHGIFR
ncbi:MAG: DUF192 domain-containing protein [Proteobacteria bacterium]|nr:DUF192 domain-containing protein [Pseudomonadota bacterium]